MSLRCNARLTSALFLHVQWFISHCCIRSGGTVLTIVELLEEAGLPPLCIAMAEEDDADRVVGEVLAEAVKVTMSHCKAIPHSLVLCAAC